MSVHEEATFEAAIERSLLGSGWLRGSSGNYDRRLGLDTSELFAFLEATQHDAWSKLTAYHGNSEAETRRHFQEYLARQIDERGPLDVLRRGVKDKGIRFRLAYFRPAHSITDDGWRLYRANRLSVTRQLYFSERDTKSLDLALFVNGIPFATAELKNPLTRQTVENAKEQYRSDRDPKELLFSRRTLVHFAVDPDLVFVTTKLAGDNTRFLPFNIGSEGPGVSGGAGNPAAPGYRTAYLWEQIWHPDTWMDLVRRFLHTDKESRALIFPRYHQWHAVTTLADHAAAHGSGENYLVMHSAGSGKSNTIAWLAHRLSSLHNTANEAVFDKVIIITDRVVLDRQLQDTVFQFEHVPGVVQRIDKDSNQLAAALGGETAKVVISTMQKFGFILEKVDNLRGRRFAVIVDEAHSSQSGDNATALKKVLLRKGSDDIDDDGDPLTASALARGRHGTLSYFAFTATPKPKTLELFGTPGADGNMHPFHTYSMRQAIEEGFILDVLRQYVTYKSYWKLANQNPDDPEVDPGQTASRLARFAVLHPTMMAQKAEIIVEHFRRHTAPRLGGRAKAMAVTGSREAAVRLYTAIRKYIETNGYAGCAPLVAFSGELEVDGAEVTEARLNGFGESELPERFGYTAADDRHAGQEYKILVVAEKYQTGFDQPLLTTMYVDKPLKGVAAVQTLSRLNRTHPLKTQGDVFVLDFVNEAGDITEQFKPYFEDRRDGTDRPEPAVHRRARGHRARAACGIRDAGVRRGSARSRRQGEGRRRAAEGARGALPLHRPGAGPLRRPGRRRSRGRRRLPRRAARLHPDVRLPRPGGAVPGRGPGTALPVRARAAQPAAAPQRPVRRHRRGAADPPAGQQDRGARRLAGGRGRAPAARLHRRRRRPAARPGQDGAVRADRGAQRPVRPGPRRGRQDLVRAADHRDDRGRDDGGGRARQRRGQLRRRLRPPHRVGHPVPPRRQRQADAALPRRRPVAGAHEPAGPKPGVPPDPPPPRPHLTPPEYSRPRNHR